MQDILTQFCFQDSIRLTGQELDDQNQVPGGLTTKFPVRQISPTFYFITQPLSGLINSYPQRISEIYGGKLLAVFSG